MSEQQLSLDFARRQRDRGMALAEMGAINANPDWPDVALEFLRRYAETHERFPMFFVVDAAEKYPALKAGHVKAWGQITRSAVKAGVIVNSGKTMPHPGRHACPAIVWVSRVYRG